MKTIKMILVGVLLVFTIACSFLPFGFNSSDTPDNAVNESMYENDVYRFLIPEGWELRQPRGEYYDLGVKQELVVESGTKSGASFTIASGPLASGETLETRFALAYREGPQIEEVSTNQFLLGTISGFEIAYQRPWGEPWWQFRDIWMEKDGIVYVLSFQAYPDDFDSQAQTFDSILDSFSFNDGETLAAEMPEAETADFPKPPSTARIAFWAHGYSMPCGSGEEIFVMNIDGSGITNISNSCGDDRDPAWSPDGKWITFTSERDGNAEVYIMNADGSNQTRVTDSPENEHYPQFSPDGKRIVFSRTIDTLASDLFIIDVDGSNLVRLTNTDRVQEMYPHWSPDGKKILFSRFGGTYNGGVWVMDADGSNDRLVHAGAYHYPRWSPDGKYIVCDGNPGVPVPDCKEEIYVMNADGSNIHMVTVHPAGCGGDNQGASWSPDGKQLVYGSSDRGPVPMPSIFKINVDGSGETRLTEQETENLYLGGHEPSWSPIP